MHNKLLFILLASLAGCSASNNLLEGRVESTVAGHNVVVTDCYRTSVPQPGSDSWTPCKDADIHIVDGNLTVNGSAYGHLKPTDGVLVDHGKVSIEKRK